MAIVVRPHHRAAFAAALDQMHRLRKRVFIDHLGWRLPRGDGVREIDDYDAGPCLYLLEMNGIGRVVGSMRLTPSEAPNVTCDVLGPQVGCVFPRGPDIVETSRECYEPELDAAARREVQSGLYAALAELHHKQGWSQAVGIAYERRIQRWIRSGSAIDILGGPYRFPGDEEASYAIRWSEDRLRPGSTAKVLGEGVHRLQDPDEDPSLLAAFADRQVA